MIDKTDIKRILKRALAEGGDFSELYLEKRRSTGITCEADRIERVVSGTDAGGGIRVISGENTAYAYSNDLSPGALEELAAVVARAARGPGPGPEPDFRSPEPVAQQGVEVSPDEVPVEQKVELVTRANRAARETDPARVKQVSVGYGDTVQEVTIANSEGLYVEDRRVRVRLAVNCIAAEGDNIQTGYEAAGGFGGLEILSGDKPEELGRMAAQRAVRMLTSRPAPAGKMAVVLAAEAGGTMIHEACGHGLEADLVQKRLSVYAGKLGQQVAAPTITVVDDGTIPRKYGSFQYDDEGTPARKTVLIENGVLRSYMYDYRTARKDGVQPTGNGRRESYQHRPIPRMSNTYIASGDSDPEEIVRGTRRGLLVKRMGGGQVNTTNGDFVFDVSEGYLIEDGQVTVPVRGATLTGNGPQVLQIIDRVGRDQGFGIGTCGKDGQGVPIGDAQPTIRIPEMTVGGLLED